MKIKLNKLSTKAPKTFDKEKIKDKTEQMIKEIAELQTMMYAGQKYSLLIILQGMDASGKDGTIRNVFGKVNPSGCKVKSFKKPTEEEYAHDFLWRIHQHTPRKGNIQIFNRSHYEDILVPSVEKFIDAKIIKSRYQIINKFENLLQQNNTKILKFYLHISKDEQKERLTERVENPLKYYKHNDGDWKTREKWDKYISVYEKIFDQCSQPEWNIIPAEQNWYKEHLVARKVLKTLKSLNMKWPGLESEMFKNKSLKK